MTESHPSRVRELKYNGEINRWRDDVAPFTGA